MTLCVSQAADIKAQTEAALEEVTAQLEARVRAELALLQRLRVQHQQQGQLEDVGVSVQAENAQTFEELKMAVQGVDALVLAERQAREEVLREALAELAAEGEERAEELRMREGRAAEAHATLEQVRPRLAFTRYCHHQYCMVYGTPKGGRRGVTYCAIVVQ